MINRREDYEFVVIDDGILVDGSIMPARIEAGNGSHAILRGEDFAFCLEASHERCEAVGLDRPSTTSASREIIGTRWVDAIRGLRRASTSFCRKDASIGTTEASGITDETRLTDIYGGLEFNQDDLVSDERAFYPGEPVRADPVKAVFKDVGSLRTFHTVVNVSRTSNEFGIVSGGDESASIPEVSASGFTLLHHVAENFLPTFPRLKAKWHRALASGGEILANPERGSFRHVSRALVAIELKIVETRTDLTSGAKVVRSWSIVHTFRADVSGGSVSVGIDAVAAAALADAESRVTLDTHETVGPDSGQDVVVTIGKSFALCTLDDHTDFSHINWS